MLSQLLCIDANALPKAEALLQITAAELIEPTYLRDKVALTIKEREKT